MASEGLGEECRGEAEAVLKAWGDMEARFQLHPPLPLLSQSNTWGAQSDCKNKSSLMFPLSNQNEDNSVIFHHPCDSRWIRVGKSGETPGVNEYECCYDYGWEEQTGGLIRWVWAYCWAAQARRMGLGFSLRYRSMCVTRWQGPIVWLST